MRVIETKGYYFMDEPTGLATNIPITLVDNKIMPNWEKDDTPVSDMLRVRSETEYTPEFFTKYNKTTWRGCKYDFGIKYNNAHSNSTLVLYLKLSPIQRIRFNLIWDRYMLDSGMRKTLLSNIISGILGAFAGSLITLFITQLIK